MRDEEYVATLYINGDRVDVGLDDYGQCYFLEYAKGDKMVVEGLGTYNSEFVEAAYSLKDTKYKRLLHNCLFEDATPEEIEEFNKYQEKFKQIELEILEGRSKARRD